MNLKDIKKLIKTKLKEDRVNYSKISSRELGSRINRLYKDFNWKKYYGKKKREDKFGSN